MDPDPQHGTISLTGRIRLSKNLIPNWIWQNDTIRPFPDEKRKGLEMMGTLTFKDQCSLFFQFFYVLTRERWTHLVCWKLNLGEGLLASC